MLMLLRHGRRSVTAAFAPTDIAGLQLWLKADSLSLNDGDPVATWTDGSGNGRNATQAVAAAKPLYKTNIVNGKPVVRFDGVDDTMAGTIATGASGLIFLVAKFVVAGNNQRVFGGASAHIMTGNLNNRWTYNATEAFGDAALEAGASSAAFGVVCLEWDSAAAARGYVNSTTATAADFDPHNNLTTVVAYDIGTGDGTFANVDIPECGWYTPKPSAGNRSSLINYLGTKYGVTIA